MKDSKARKLNPGVLIQPVGGLGNQFFSFFAGYIAAESRRTQLVVDMSRKDKGVTAHGVSIANFSLTAWPGVEKVQNRKSMSRFLFVGADLLKKLNSSKAAQIFKAYTSSSPDLDWETLSSSTPSKIFLRGHFITQKVLDEASRLAEHYPISLLDESEDFLRARSELALQNPVCLHIRRGDYLRADSQQSILGLEYYCDALDLIVTKDRPLWIFTDSPGNKDVLELVKRYHAIVVPSKFRLSPEEEFALLLSSSTIVAGNSTFSLMALALGNALEGILPANWSNTTPGLRVDRKINVRYLDATYID
jgi:hypothetical protein